ncbi:MAG: hypothetical protein EAY81_11840 [Bacteroidetes bacterium]|nr:MAG: hypothetical protein EAY81_11840 [Bacteroidota bacterium]
MALILPKRLLFSTVCLLLILNILSSCSYKRKNILFKTPKKIKTQEAVVVYDQKGELKTANYSDYKHRIKVGDRILISFLNNYDIGKDAEQSATSTANIGNSKDDGYLVNYDSTITLPLIGRINIVGLTRLEAAKKLEGEYGGRFVINPIIEVNIASLSVTILGEITSPGKILLDKENTSLVDVIALSGGLRDTGKKNRIRIMRNDEIILVDLRKIESLNSKSIIIQDGDIIYVEPYGIKSQTEAVTTLQGLTFIVLSISQLTILSLQIINILN